MDSTSDSDSYVNISEASSDEIEVCEVRIRKIDGMRRGRRRSVCRTQSFEDVRMLDTDLVRHSEDEPSRKRPRVDLDSAVEAKTLCFAGYPELVEEIKRLISHAKQTLLYGRLGVEPPRGVLLHGPHGSGKTLLVRTIAKELGLPLYIVDAHEMICFASYARLRSAFDNAAVHSPAVIFLDGLDVVMERKDVVFRLLSAMDVCAPGVMVVGSCVNPDAIDSSLRTTGRFDREIGIGVPCPSDRRQILEVLTQGMRLSADLSHVEMASLTPGFVGGDLKALTAEAGIAAVDRTMTLDVDEEENPETPNATTNPANDRLQNLCVTRNDFMTALKIVQPSTKRKGFASVPEVTWDDVGSLSGVKRKLETAILWPVSYPDKFTALGIERPMGILLWGPPGCGKTLLAKALANQAGINFLSVKGPEILSSYVGESERAVRTIFQQAKTCRPCVLFVDEIDALCAKRYAHSGESNGTARVVNQFLTEMDGFGERNGVFLLAASNRPDILDPAVLRPGRLDMMIWVGLPTVQDRVDILRALTRRVPLSDVDLEQVGRDPRLEGFTGADLSALIKEACVAALSKHLENDSELKVTTQMILDVAAKQRPSVTEKDMKVYRQIRMTFGDGNSKT